jgi:transposase
VTEIVSAEEKLIICATSEAVQAECPACGTRSQHVHSYYYRSAGDMPTSGHAVQLQLRVRRFRCLNRACSKKTFAEPLPDLIAPIARRTNRLTALFHTFAIASGGEPGARLLKAVGTKVSPDTLLRLAKAEITQEFVVPSVLGVDDFAFRRRHTYGTLLIDWERHCPIDMLPDRTADTFANWLRAHPGVKWISRDRSGEYARGAQLGAPLVGQIMDRWHVIKNLREALERVLTRLSPRLSQWQHSLNATPFPKRKKERTTNEQDASEVSRELRLTRYEQVLECNQQGVPITQIAQRLHVSRGTIYKYLATDGFPERAPRSASVETGQILAPYMMYLRQRCEEGCQNGQQLYREIHMQGFSGNPRTVLRWLQAQGLFPRRYELRRAQDNWDQQKEKEAQFAEEEKPALIPTSQKQPLTIELTEPLASARQLSYLLVKDPLHLEIKDQRVLAFIQQEKEIELSYWMTQQFIHLLKNKQGNTAAMAWISVCSSCGISELETFALGLQKELPAFQAACALPYSNGMTEGFVNKLKYIKRSMYGRGSFELLRQRVLQSTSSGAA